MNMMVLRHYETVVPFKIYNSHVSLFREQSFIAAERFQSFDG